MRLENRLRKLEDAAMPDTHGGSHLIFWPEGIEEADAIADYEANSKRVVGPDDHCIIVRWQEST